MCLQDIASKIMAFSQQGPRTVCILSANGAICNVTLRQPAMSGGTVSYEVTYLVLDPSDTNQVLFVLFYMYSNMGTCLWSNRLNWYGKCQRMICNLMTKSKYIHKYHTYSHNFLYISHPCIHLKTYYSHILHTFSISKQNSHVQY